MIDLTRRNDIEYVISTAISFNPDGVRKATARAYGASYGLISSDESLKRFLVNRVNDGLSIDQAFEVPISPQSESAREAMRSIDGSAMPEGKSFEDTFVGSLIYLLFPPDTGGNGVGSNPCPQGMFPNSAGVCVGYEQNAWSVKDILWVLGGIVVGIILITLALRFLKP